MARCGWTLLLTNLGIKPTTANLGDPKDVVIQSTEVNVGQGGTCQQPLPDPRLWSQSRIPLITAFQAVLFLLPCSCESRTGMQGNCEAYAADCVLGGARRIDLRTASKKALLAFFIRCQRSATYSMCGRACAAARAYPPLRSLATISICGCSTSQALTVEGSWSGHQSLHQSKLRGCVAVFFIARFGRIIIDFDRGADGTRRNMPFFCLCGCRNFGFYYDVRRNRFCTE